MALSPDLTAAIAAIDNAASARTAWSTEVATAIVKAAAARAIATSTAMDIPGTITAVQAVAAERTTWSPLQCVEAVHAAALIQQASV